MKRSAQRETAPKPTPTGPSGIRFDDLPLGGVAPVYDRSRSVSLDPVLAQANRCVALMPEAAELASYKILRTQVIHRTQAQGRNTIMIAGVHPGDGATLTTVNLALTFAREFNQTVMVVDCNLKNQQVHRYLGYASHKGLCNCLLDDLALSDVIVWPGIPRLTVISGGSGLSDSAEILGSPRMTSLVQEAKNRYKDRYILFDLPPILHGADAIAFARMVDAIVLVVQSGKTSVHDVRRAVELIPHEKLLGFVFNRHGLPAAGR